MFVGTIHYAWDNPGDRGRSVHIVATNNQVIESCLQNQSFTVQPFISSVDCFIVIR